MTPGLAQGKYKMSLMRSIISEIRKYSKIEWGHIKRTEDQLQITLTDQDWDQLKH